MGKWWRCEGVQERFQSGISCDNLTPIPRLRRARYLASLDRIFDLRPSPRGDCYRNRTMGVSRHNDAVLYTLYIGGLCFVGAGLKPAPT